jgi:hypothetical protein
MIWSRGREGSRSLINQGKLRATPRTIHNNGIVAAINHIEPGCNQRRSGWRRTWRQNAHLLATGAEWNVSADPCRSDRLFEQLLADIDRHPIKIAGMCCAYARPQSATHLDDTAMLRHIVAREGRRNTCLKERRGRIGSEIERFWLYAHIHRQIERLSCAQLVRTRRHFNLNTRFISSEHRRESQRAREVTSICDAQRFLKRLQATDPGRTKGQTDCCGVFGIEGIL